MGEQGKLLLPEYRAYIEELSNAKVSLWAHFESAGRAFACLGDIFPIGCVEVSLDAPKNPLASDELSGDKILFSKENWNRESVLTYTYRTGEGGRVVYSVYAEEGRTFEASMEPSIHTLIDILLAFSGRARLGSILDRAIRSDIQTGLPNMFGFQEHLCKLFAQRKLAEFDAFFLNLKNFKYINKIVDQKIGDEVIIEYSQRMQASLEPDETIARLGGDNFVAVIKRCNRDKFLRLLRGIQITFDSPSGPKNISISAVAGGYEIPENLHNPGEVLLPISEAYQAAKRIYKRDVVFYTPEIDKLILESQRVLVNFEYALKEHEFETYYQPKVDLKTGKICGAEALARWNQNGQVIPPVAFIPFLEKDGSICKLDMEILRQVCEHMSQWIQSGRDPVRTSVNLSRWHLQNPHLVDDIIRILHEYGIEPKYLEFELTETMDYEEYQIMESLFTSLHEEGLHTSIDDFGTGYSSLNLLRKVQVDVLKLDKSFLTGLDAETTGARDHVLIRNVINMAKELNMQVLAEGVETEQQRDLLIAYHCDVAQGFFYSKPVPRIAFERMEW